MRSHTPKGQRALAKIVTAAEHLFASDGFHGASVRDIAKRARVPLATLVYHYPTKEKLYAAVLHQISDELVAELTSLDAIATWAELHPERVRLLLRELLDNPARVAHASQLPLAPVLERAAKLAGGPAPELAVMHLVGALSYVVVAWPTIERIVGPDRAAVLAKRAPRDAKKLIGALT